MVPAANAIATKGKISDYFLRLGRAICTSMRTCFIKRLLGMTWATVYNMPVLSTRRLLTLCIHLRGGRSTTALGRPRRRTFVSLCIGANPSTTVTGTSLLATYFFTFFLLRSSSSKSRSRMASSIIRSSKDTKYCSCAFLLPLVPPAPLVPSFIIKFDA